MKFKDKTPEGIIKKLIIVLLATIILRIVLDLYSEYVNQIHFFISFTLGLIFPILFGFIFAYLLWPMVRKIEGFVKSRMVGILLSYLVIFAILIYILAFFIPQLYYLIQFVINYDYSNIVWLENFVNDVTGIELLSDGNISYLVTNIDNVINVSKITSMVTGWLGSVVSFSTGIMFSFVISIYVLTRYEMVRGKVKYFFPPNKREKNMELIYDINYAVRSYFEGFLTIGLINSSSAFFVYLLTIGDFQSALGLAMFLFVFYSIPFIGMIIAGFPAVILAFQSDVFPLISGIIVIIFLIALTNISANIIEPRIYGSKIGVDPLVVLIGIIVFSTLFGFAGLILAMPLVAVSSVLFTRVRNTYKQWFEEYKEEENNKNEN